MTKLSQYHLEAYGCPLPKITSDEEAVASFMKVQPRLECHPGGNAQEASASRRATQGDNGGVVAAELANDTCHDHQADI